MSQAYLESLLEERFPTEEAVMTELINLEAIQSLPKGTELYISDIHGEYTAFDHILRIGSGNVKEKINNLYHEELTAEEVERLTLIVAYPEWAIARDPVLVDGNEEELILLIERLIEILKFTSAKYTRSKLRKTLPDEYRYVMEELLYADYNLPHKEKYSKQIIHLLFKLNKVHDFVQEIAFAIQRLVIDRLHVIGDVFDRGSEADRVMDRIIHHPSVDFQWGNHDMLWIGAYYGSESCLLTLLRIGARYDYLFDLESSYGLNLRPLFLHAKETYQANPAFTPKHLADDISDESRIEMEQVHQALSIIQFKLEEQLLNRRPEFAMDKRKLLQAIDFEKQTVAIEGKTYPLENTCFQTIDPENPTALTAEERNVVEALMYSYQNSDKLAKHIEFMAKEGTAYLIYNNHLLFHGCIPLTDDGELKEVEFRGKKYQGKALLDYFSECLHTSTQNKNIRDDYETDLFWYNWAGEFSPLFGKAKMTTFERYFIQDKETHKEEKNAYFKLRHQRRIAEMVLREFGLTNERSAIINGHTPVKAKKGEEPIKAGGKLFVIDGGLSSAYHGTTGIAGYSLLNNSIGFQVVTHQPFSSIEKLFENKSDGTYVKRVIDKDFDRTLIRETSTGAELQEQINVLKDYLANNLVQ